LLRGKTLPNLNFCTKPLVLKIIVFLICWINALMLCAQSVPTTIGARASGMGNTSSCVTDEWALFNNIGGLAKINSTVTGFTYENRPSLKGANRMAFVFATPVSIGVAGLGIFRFGDDVYSEQVISAGYSNTFGLASLGVKVNYIQYRAEGFGSKGLISINAGGLAQLTPRLSIGVHIINLTQQKISEADEREYLPTLLVAGVGIKVSDKIQIVTEVEKDLNYTANIKAGIEYQVHKKLAFRTGFNFSPAAGYFGIGFKPKKFSLDYAFRYDPNLGGSHQASVGYIIKAK
jgi:hypothetical protein